MELLASIAGALGALLALATAAVNLITAIRSRTRRSTANDQQIPQPRRRRSGR